MLIHKPLTLWNVINYINLQLLHDLEYINIDSKLMYLPGGALMKIQNKTMVEDLIFLFELSRHNFLKPDYNFI